MFVDLGNGNKIILTIESVVKCMGIRGTGIDLEEDDLQLEASVREKLSTIFETCGPKQLPSTSDLHRVLVRDYGMEMSKEEEDKFVVALVAYCCAHVLAPTDRAAVVPRNIWKFVSDAHKVRCCNWAKYILRVIASNAAELQRNIRLRPAPHTIRLAGCWLYLEVITGPC
jgi:hypothetical protein